MAARQKPASKKPAPKKKATAAKAAPKKAPKAAAKKPVKKVAAKAPAPKKKVAAKASAPKKAPKAAAKEPAKKLAPRQAKAPKVGELGAITAAEIAGMVAAETATHQTERSQELTTADGGHARAPAPAKQAEVEVAEGMPAAGDQAPAFSLVSETDETVTLASLRGRQVVLYFYPKDNTPGCTREAQDFSSLLPEFEAKNAVVLGVSTDSAESHRKFRKTCDLSVKLLADPDKRAHEAYGTWREKKNYGRTYMGTQRSTFLIDEQGRIAKVWPKVRVEDHALDVLNSLK